MKKREVILKLAMKRAMNNSVHLLSIFKLIGFVLYSVFIVDVLPAILWSWALRFWVLFGRNVHGFFGISESFGTLFSSGFYH